MDVKSDIKFKNNLEAPSDINTEKALIGSLLFKSNKFDDVSSIITSDMFYVPKHKKIFEVMQEINKEGNAIDHITVKSKLADKLDLDYIGGDEYINELINEAPVTNNLESYSKIIKNKYVLRQLQATGSFMYDLSMKNGEIEDIIEEAEKTLFGITQDVTQVKYKSIGEIVPELIDEITSIAENEKKHRGIETGFNKLNNALSGFHPSDLIIVAARPSVGKTSFALDIARKSAMKEGTKVGIFSIEMSAEQLSERLIASESMLDAWQIRTGRLKSQEDLKILNSASDKIAKLPIFIDERSTVSTLNLRQTARRMKKEMDINLLIIDYLQLIEPHDSKKSDNRVQHVTEISKTLKQIARELKIPVIALSQLSRDVERGDGRKPRLSDLRDSGSIEQDADVVMFLHRTSNVHDDEGIETDLLIEKHRNGPTGRVNLIFNKRFATFTEKVDDYTEDEYSDKF